MKTRKVINHAIERAQIGEVRYGTRAEMERELDKRGAMGQPAYLIEIRQGCTRHRIAATLQCAELHR